MQAGATPSPADRLAFANQLKEVRALDTEDKYKEQLNELEIEYKFVLLRSLDLFHKEMRRANLPEKLHAIKEALSETAGEFTYHTNLPFNSWNWDIKRCRLCKRAALKHRPDSHELCCENCGLIESLDGVAFDYNEVYRCGDYKVTKQRRSNRRYNFRYYLEKHVKHCASKGFHLSCETVQQAYEFFDAIEAQLPKCISLPFVAFKIFEQIVKSDKERFILSYFWVQVPEGTLKRHAEKWEEMLRQFDA